MRLKAILSHLKCVPNPLIGPSRKQKFPQQRSTQFTNGGKPVAVCHARRARTPARFHTSTPPRVHTGFVAYTALAVAVILLLVYVAAPSHGATNIFVYLGICSLAGSLSVMSCKALGIAIKLTLQGNNQLLHVQTHLCAAVVAVCVVTQMNYLNKALDIFNTAVVSPVYYVMFTTLTIAASVIMFRDVQGWAQLAGAGCGFVTIVGGTFLLHTTKDMQITLGDLGVLSM
eukprot:364954-Chlamydomonas_euryale.AAC.7